MSHFFQVGTPSLSYAFRGKGCWCRSKPHKPGVKRTPTDSFFPLIISPFSGVHKSQSSVSVGSLSFIWKQSLSWPRVSGCFRTDVQTRSSAARVSLIHIQKWKRCPGVLKQSLGSFPAPLDLMTVSYLANLASALVYQRLLIAILSFSWQ